MCVGAFGQRSGGVVGCGSVSGSREAFGSGRAAQQAGELAPGGDAELGEQPMQVEADRP